MDRRRFLGTAALAGASLALGKAGRALAAPGKPDLVAVKNGEPAAMFDRGIQELGGMKAFVKPGQKVLVKPNIGWDVPPERAGNTHPALVARIVEQALAAGAKEVYVFDHSCDDGRRCYKTSGIEAAAQAAGAKVAPGYMEGSYQRVDLPNGEELIYAKVHELLLAGGRVHQRPRAEEPQLLDAHHRHEEPHGRGLGPPGSGTPTASCSASPTWPPTGSPTSPWSTPTG